MRGTNAASPEAIECPLCLGKGLLSRTEVLERLGMKDFARVAQFSAEEAIRLLTTKEKDDEGARWVKFDAELARRVAEVTGKHSAELQKVQAEKGELAARLKGFERPPPPRSTTPGRRSGWPPGRSFRSSLPR